MQPTQFSTSQQAGEQELWRQFESTGSVQEYLRYRRAKATAGEENSDAVCDDGPGGQGGEGWRG